MAAKPKKKATKGKAILKAVDAPAPEPTVRRLEYVALDELEGATRNPKKHLGEEIGKSIGRFGYVEPVVLDERTHRLVAGHGRIQSLRVRQAAKESPPEGVKEEGGRWLIPVLRGWASRSDTEAEAYLVASNQLTIGGGWDEAQFAAMLKDLSDSHALEGVGISEEELARLLSGMEDKPNSSTTDEDDPEGIDDVPELPAERDVYVQPGDVYQLGRHTITCGDSREVLARAAPASMDAVVTDPPYELGFMGKAWDASGIAYDGTLWGGVLGVLKPGGHLLAFGGTRTYHRMTCAIEDAGFEVRDCIMWLYGTGFPKSLDVSKALDAQAGAERKVVGKKAGTKLAVAPGQDNDRSAMALDVTAPSTAAAKQWAGWGTALKPAVEPAVLARKPMAGTVATNLIAHGVGALNIDGSRIGTDAMPRTAGSGELLSENRSMGGGNYGRVDAGTAVGRWPSNVMLDADAAKVLDEQAATEEGASRFFYVAKPSRSERDEGLEAGANPDDPLNFHPTVKPVALMRYLARLVTPPGGRILEPFSGSGTTLVACERAGFVCFAVEKEPAYVQLAIGRWEGLTGLKAVKSSGEQR